VELIATNAFNCKDTSQGVLIVYPSPVANFSSSQSSLCPGTNVNLVNTSVGAVSQTWHFGDGTGTSISSNVSHLFDNTQI
jgi:PKD repeat protein